MALPEQYHRPVGCWMEFRAESSSYTYCSRNCDPFCAIETKTRNPHLETVFTFCGMIKDCCGAVASVIPPSGCLLDGISSRMELLLIMHLDQLEYPGTLREGP